MWYVRSSSLAHVNKAQVWIQINESIRFPGLSFKSSILKRHIESDCGRKPLSKCKPCDKSFFTVEEEKAHKKSHQSITTCNICGKEYENFHQLIGHLTGHRTANSFECKYCGQRFSQRLKMMGHMTKHTGIKSFQCLGCNERFAALSKLQSHRKARKKTCWLVR